MKIENVIRENVGSFDRVIGFRPAWDKRDPDPKKNYGIHCVDALFLVVRNHTAVEFQLMTGWWPPKNGRRADPIGPLPSIVSYHAPQPWADYLTEPTATDCRWTGGVCYCDGSALDALSVFDVLVMDGLDAMWRQLEQRWVEQFGGRYA